MLFYAAWVKLFWTQPPSQKESTHLKLLINKHIFGFTEVYLKQYYSLQQFQEEDRNSEQTMNCELLWWC